MVKMREATTHIGKKTRNATELILQEALDGHEKIEILSRALGLNSRFAHHRNIKRRARSRANSIKEMKQKYAKVRRICVLELPAHSRFLNNRQVVKSPFLFGFQMHLSQSQCLLQ